MAADAYSPSLGAIEQGTGNNNNSWGTNLNGALTALDLGVAGYVTNAVTGGNLALDGVIPPAGQHPLVQMLTNFTGVLASNQTVTVPNVSKMWIVNNQCTGAFTLKFKTTAGAASAAIPVGQAIVYCDGSNNMFVLNSTSLRDVQWLGADGTLALPGISFASESSSGLRRKSAGVLSLVIGGVEIATISATGIDITSGLQVTVGGVNPVPPGFEMTAAAIAAPAGWYLEYGQTITRSTDTPLMNAITQVFTATTNGTTVLTSVSVDLRNLGLEGSVLEGTGMATGATIVSVDSATQITMSLAATNSASGGSVRAFPYGNGDGSTTFTLPDARGTVAAGRDNMGGTAANKLTTAGSGVNGLRLNVVAGAQNVTLDATMIPAHQHGVYLKDPQHSHTLNPNTAGVNFGGGGAGNFNSGSYATGGNTVNSNTTGITIGSVNGVANDNQTAAIGGGLAHNNTQPTRIRNVMIKR